MIFLQGKVPLGPLWSGQVENLAGDELVWSSDTWSAAVPDGASRGKSSANFETWRKTANTKEKHVYERKSKLQRIEFSQEQSL